MPAPKNKFKQAIKSGELQIGCWAGLAEPYISEITAGAGFDWVVIDAEHAPNDLRSITAQLQVMAAFDVHPVVRPTTGETWLIKPILDAGVQNLLVPMIESAEHAREMVKAITYPPHGTRGVGAALARASSFMGIPDYLQTADDEICLMLQVESRKGLEALDDILEVDGVDGVFIGPSDLAADMGYIGKPNEPEVEEAVLDAMKRICNSGKAGGILTLDVEMQKKCKALGATFIATNLDVGVFAKGMRAAAAKSKEDLKSV